MLRWTLHQRGEGKAIRAVVAVDDQVYCFGGQSRSEAEHRRQANVHVFSPASLSWRTLPQVAIEKGGERPLEIPAACRGCTAVLIGHVVYVWGGRTRRLYAFHVDTHRWLKSEVSGTVPDGRYHHAACVSGKVMFVHGGWTVNLMDRLHAPRTGWIDNMYKLDTSTMVWSFINTSGITHTWLFMSCVPPLRPHSVTIIGTKMYVCGSDYEDNVKVFDTETDSWLVTPKTRVKSRQHGFCADSRHFAFAHDGELYTVSDRGGYPRKFHPETFSWTNAGPAKGPSTMSYCCTVGDRVVFFGGGKNPDELHILDLSPSLKTLCKLEVIQYNLEQLGLPHNIRWELAAMIANDNATEQEQRTSSGPGNKRKRPAVGGA